MWWSIVVSSISLLIGAAVLVHWWRECIRRPADFMAKHTVYESQDRPDVRARKVGRGTQFVNVGGTGKFRPPEGFENIEVLVEETRNELLPLKWLGIAFVAVGALSLLAGLLAAAVIR